MPIPNYKKFLSEDPLADTSDSDYDPNSDEEENNLKEKNE